MDDKKIELLKQEYAILQNSIESFDARAITIKAWSITFSLTALAGAFASHSKAVLLVAGFSAVLFWIIESMWKAFQYAFYKRNSRIEDYFAGRTDDVVPCQIGREWYAAWRSGGLKRFFRAMFWAHVALPHAAILLVGVALFVLTYTGLVAI